MSKAIRLQPWLSSKDYDPSDQNQNLYDALRDVIGSKYSDESCRLLSEDFLVYDGNDDVVNNQCHNSVTESARVMPLLEFRLPKQQGKAASCWQHFNIRNMPDLLQPMNACKLVDQRGVVVGLQPQLIDAISREVAS